MCWKRGARLSEMCTVSSTDGLLRLEPQEMIPWKPKTTSRREGGREGREERGEPAGREVEAPAPAPGRMHFSALQSSSCGGTPGSLVAMARAAFVALGNFLRPKVPEEDERTFYLTPGRALHSGDHVS